MVRSTATRSTSTKSACNQFDGAGLPGLPFFCLVAGICVANARSARVTGSVNFRRSFASFMIGLLRSLFGQQRRACSDLGFSVRVIPAGAVDAALLLPRAV